MEYCMIVIDKLISPHTPTEQVEPLLRDLMDSVYHPQMKELAQKIVDPDLDLAERRKLKEKFRNFDHGGANDYADVNYKDLIDKLLDPNLPDVEYKPTMKALLDGDLDQDKKNMVSAIISCQNKEQQSKMVKRFKSLFDREKEEREKAERERKEAKAAKERAKAELEANLLKFDDDGMTLIYKFLDKKIPREKKTEIYERLMEPDIDAEIKNLAIQIVNTNKAADRPQLIEDFKKRREEEKILAIKRKEEEAKRKAAEEQEMKELKMQRKNHLLDQKKKSEMMKKRDLMLKYRAEDRRRESQYGVVGPSSVQEREEWRRKEREKMKAEIVKFREEARLKMLRQEREETLKQGWMVKAFNSSYNINIKVVVPDLASSLAPDQQLQFQRAIAALKAGEGMESERGKVTESNESSVNKSETAIPEKSQKSDQKADAKVESEFDKYFKIFVDPSLTEEAESSHVKQLIIDKKSALVRSLAIRLATVPGAGKSKVFQNLIKKLCPDKSRSDPHNHKTEEAAKEGPAPAKTLEKSTAKSKTEEAAKEGPIPAKPVEEPTGKPAEQATGEEKTGDETVEVQEDGNPKRRLSNDSNNGCESKKIKLVHLFEEDQTKEKEEKKSMMKKKKHKHKEERGKEGEKGDRALTDKNGDKKKKKHKNKEKEKKKEKDKDKRASIDKKRSSTESRCSDSVKEKKKEKDKDKRASIDKQRSSTESRCSDSVKVGVMPLLQKSLEEIRREYQLTKLDVRVKIKNCRNLYRVILKQDIERDRRWEEENSASEPRSRSNSTGKKTPSRPQSSASNKSDLSRSSKSHSVRSRSPTRSRSNSARSRSPVRYVSRSRSRSTIKSRSPTMSRSPTRSRDSSRSKSISRSPLRSPSRSSSPSSL